uniref:Cohesin loading complex subunit SCC4 homolog n=1 Tax=Tetradesmus obliquus TaxID=3088 RepID=A0A383VZC9_TETOB|eukprot:jgi/Sobl393_1/4828/SZX70280.1
MATAAEVQGTLQVLASRLAADGHFLKAIQCYTAILGQSLLPADEATARLQLAQLLLEHTHNVSDAKQHLQKADLLVAQLPGQPLLKCEVLAQLGRAHKYLGETPFQRQCYLKGLELCKQHISSSSNNSSNKRGMAEWAVYFHLHTAESYTTEQDSLKAAEHADAAAELAQQQGLLEQQLLCIMFKLQVIMLSWDRKEAEQAVGAAAAVLQQLEQQGGAASPAFVALLKLQFTMLQVMLSIHAGNFEDLAPPNQNKSPIVADLEAQCESLLQLLGEQQQMPYRWLPAAALGALVQLLAAIILKPGGKMKQALLHISRGLQLVDQQLAALHVGPTTTEASLDHISTYEVRSCLVLRVLLLEVQQQLQLLSTSYAAACQTACESIALLQRFPGLLGGMRPSVHLAAGLYAQSMNAFNEAQAHYAKAAASHDSHMRVCGQCMAALCILAQEGIPKAASVSRGRELLGELVESVDSRLGYAERAVANIASGLLQLAAPDGGSVEKSDAKQRLSKALKLAHGRLQNHQVVSQVLLFMAPLQIQNADVAGAHSMVTSSFTLAKGALDLPAQVASLSMMQQLYHHSQQADKAGQNANYLLRKQEELSAKIQEAESAAQQHTLVLKWDL